MAWRNLAVIVTMRGIVLIDKDVPVRLGIIRWDLDGSTLHDLVNNFDSAAPDSDPSVADPITVTCFAEDGNARAAAAIVTHGPRVPVVPAATC